MGYGCTVRSVVLSAFILVGGAFACSSGNGAGDGGTDGAVDGATGLCDLEAFKASGGDGHACPRASVLVCFPLCSTGGCRCTSTSAGPRWKCTTDLSCQPDAAPVADSGADAPDDAAVDAAADAAAD